MVSNEALTTSLSVDLLEPFILLSLGFKLDGVDKEVSIMHAFLMTHSDTRNRPIIMAMKP